MGVGSNLGSNVSATQEHSDAPKASKHGLRVLSDAETVRLGAGRSQVRAWPPQDVRLTATGVVPLKAAASDGVVGIGVEDGMRAART
jgi:hypothetical protein